jgi:tetratricopeptide (TPR) repeat protein
MQFRCFLVMVLISVASLVSVQNRALSSPVSDNPAIFSTNELRKTAQEITVFIENDEKKGSGLIISRTAQSYYVLTSAHILGGKDTPIQITTPDLHRYEASVVARRLHNLDLAILEFKSPQAYRLATLAGYDQPNNRLIDAGNVYISGWDALRSSNTPVFSCGIKFQGDMAALLFVRKDPISDGYELAYTNITQPGLSGGPIFDVQGRVVGIHGQAEGANFDGVGSIKLGFSLGIPIRRFLEVVQERSIRLPLIINQKPLNISTSQSWVGPDPCEQNTPSIPTADADGLEWANYANSMLRLFRLVDALSAYDKAIEKKEELYELWYGRGLALLLLNRPNEALKTFNKASNLLDTSQPAGAEELRSANLSRSVLLHYQGMLLSKQENYQEALVKYNEALKLQPDNSQFWMLKANTLRDLNQDQEAIKAYGKAIQIEPRYVFYLSRGSLYSQASQYSLAIEDMTTAIQLDPTNPQSYALRGAFKKKIGDEKGSMNDYEQVNKLTYSSPT